MCVCVCVCVWGGGGGGGQVKFLVVFRGGHCIYILLGGGVIQNLNTGSKF